VQLPRCRYARRMPTPKPAVDLRISIR
jgi:hypothetical protein